MQLDVKTTYPIHLLHGVTLELIENIKSTLGRECAFVLDENVALHYPNFVELLHPHFLVPAGEASKSQVQKAAIEEQLFAAGFNRDSCFFAIGGGVTLDLMGFIAATFCRGVPVIYIPTTLLSMIDVCVGGKTGINTNYGKNTLGTFTTPQQVIIDTAFLNTLSALEFKAGLVESLKHALIADAPFFAWHLENKELIESLAVTALHQLIKNNLAIKAEIVAQDTLEQGGIRQILNFGHTIGHALESCSQYTLKHGEAVALGILTENFIAEKLGFLHANDCLKIGHALTQFNCLQPLPATCMKINDVFSQLKYDKKCTNQQVQCILLEKIGQIYRQNQSYTVPLASDLLKQAIMWLQAQSQHGFREFT